MNTFMTRRRRGAILAGSLSIATVLALAGCSQPAPQADPTAAEEDIELTVLNQSRGQEAALNQLAEQYTEETGVKVTIDSPGPADYLP